VAALTGVNNHTQIRNVKKDKFSHTALEGMRIRKMFSQIHHYTVYSALMPLVMRLVGREFFTDHFISPGRAISPQCACVCVYVSVCLSVCQDNDNF